MKTKLNSAGQWVEVDDVPQMVAKDVELIGAAQTTACSKHILELWEMFASEHTAKVLETASSYMFGKPEEIEIQLNDRYPCERSDCKYVVAVPEVNYRKHGFQAHYISHEYGIRGYMVLDIPVLTDVTMEHIVPAVAELGVVLIPNVQPMRPALKEALVKNFYTCVDYIAGYSTIRHNPKHVKRTLYVAKKKEYDKYTCGMFRNEDMNNLINRLAAAKWTNDGEYNWIGLDHYLPYHDEFNQEGVYKFCIKTRRTLEFCKKLRLGNFWRCDAFTRNLENMLSYLHGVEDYYATVYKVDAESGLSADKLAEKYDAVFYMCRWLRKEARAAKLKIPPRLKKPLTEPERRKLERENKRKRLERNKRAQLRRKEQRSAKSLSKTK